MKIQAIIADCNHGGEGRRLDIFVEFAGGPCAIFWLYKDAEAAAKAMSLETPDVKYSIVTPGDPEMGGPERVTYVNGERVDG